VDFSGFPVFSGDLFSDELLADSHGAYRTLRELGDAVWLPTLNMFAVARFHDVQAGLRASDALISGKGVSVNELMNAADAPDPVSTLTSDGEVHHQLKRTLMKPLMPTTLQPLRERIAREAATIVDQLTDGREFEAMSTLASHVPVTIVADMVGLKSVSHKQLMQWASAIFDAFGPVDRARTAAALPAIQDFVGHGMQLTRDDLVPGGWAHSLFLAAERGEITLQTARNLVFDYALPSLDTTILATGELLYRMATEPGALEAVQSRPALIPGVVNECVRLASPLRGFTRYCAQDFAFSDNTIPAGSRVWLLNASANRDERHYPDPDRFAIERNPRDHLGWGHGVHSCLGIHLARLELEIILETLAARLHSIEAGPPTRLVNNAAQGYATLPLRLQRARPAAQGATGASTKSR
jgi:cytochrome P450